MKIKYIYSEGDQANIDEMNGMLEVYEGYLMRDIFCQYGMDENNASRFNQDISRINFENKIADYTSRCVPFRIEIEDLTDGVELKREESRATELEFLRWIYSEYDFCLEGDIGPARHRIINRLNEKFVDKTGKQLPEGYSK